MAYVQKMIIQHNISLVSFNLALGISMGSLFHVASASIFSLSQKNIFILYLFTTLIGTATSLVFFWAGIKILNKRFGAISAILYSSSFFISLFDRRWWLLSFDMLLTALALLSLFMVTVKKKYIFLILLAIGTGLALHTDPTLGVIPLSSIIILVLFKTSVPIRKLLPAIFTLILFVLPLLVFELRHPGTLIRPALTSIQGKISSANSVPNLGQLSPYHTLDTFGRVLFLPGSSRVDTNFCYCTANQYTQPLVPLISRVVVLLILLAPLYWLITKKFPENTAKFIKINYLYLATFFIGISIYSLLYRSFPYQQYFLMAIPSFVFLAAFIIYRLTIKNTTALVIVLTVFALINFTSLSQSSFEFPSLAEKLKLVEEVKGELGNSQFSLYVSPGIETHNNGFGFTYLFISKGLIPQKSYLYRYIYWTMLSHNLFLIPPQERDPERIVVIYRADTKPQLRNVLSVRQGGVLQAAILDNSSGWFLDNFKIRTQ